jgi:hypothetical protein
MVTFEVVHKGIEGIIQAEKVHCKKKKWQAHKHRHGENPGILPDPKIKPRAGKDTRM